MHSKSVYGILASAGLTLSACSSPSGMAPLVAPPAQTELAPTTSIAGKYIKHVVIIVQENRSFDNIFAGFPGSDTEMYGYMHDGTQVQLQPIPYENALQKGLDHSYAAAMLDWDHGKMDGFGQNTNYQGQPVGSFAYSYLERNEVKPYWGMAKNYVLADHMFPTIFGPSFTGHLALIAGTADLTPTESVINVPSGAPWGCDAPSGTATKWVNEQHEISSAGPFPCFTQFRTMADTLDAAHVSWRYYAPSISSGDTGGIVWSTFDAIKNVRYGSDWSKKIVSPPTRILTAAENNALPSVAWVVPDWLWSDHPNAQSSLGPSWVAAVVDKIGRSKDWKSTAIVVVWDDWGGWFDNVPPPQPDFRGLGIRVGCLIISPYVQPHVSHTRYEFGSILKFVEQVFGLPRLGSQSDGYTDGRAKSILDSFDFTQAPRKFKWIFAPYPPSYFLQQAPSLRAPDTE